MGRRSHKQYFILRQIQAFNLIRDLVLFILFLQINIQSNYASDSIINTVHLNLIQEAASEFVMDDPLQGYEIFIRKFNETIPGTIFLSEHLQDIQVLHNNSDDIDQKLVILPGNSEIVQVPFKNVKTYLVLRQINSKPDRYTSHLAYIRNFIGEISVEWDLYSFHFHDPNGSFVSAFFPTRKGPDFHTHSLDEEQKLRRLKRWLQIESSAPVGDAREAIEMSKIYKSREKRKTTNGRRIRKKKKRRSIPTDLEKVDLKIHEIPSALNDLNGEIKGKRQDEQNDDILSLNVTMTEISKKYLHKDYMDKLESPFVGIRECDYTPVNELKIPQTQDELIKFFLKVVRVGCLPQFEEKLKKLFDIHLVEMGNETMQILLKHDHLLFNKSSLGDPEQMELSSSVFLTAFANAFASQLKKFQNKTLDNFSPDKKNLSGTVKTLTLFTFNVLEATKSGEKSHAIMLVNFLLVALQAHRSELVTSREELDQCTECVIQKEINFNDHLQLISLMRFLVDDLGEIIQSKDNGVETNFIQFYNLHLNSNIQHVANKTPFVF